MYIFRYRAQAGIYDIRPSLLQMVIWTVLIAMSDLMTAMSDLLTAISDLLTVMSDLMTAMSDLLTAISDVLTARFSLSDQTCPFSDFSFCRAVL